MKPAVRFGLAVFAGVLLAQAAWMLAVPPFRGADEFDHAYRAAGIADGQWRLTEHAANGRGFEVEVPLDLVAAAGAQCSVLPYTGPDNCRAFGIEGGRGTVATGAGNYSPTYYAAVGLAGKASSGTGSLYAMRGLSALLCAIGLAVAAALLAYSGGSWTRLSLLTSLTPVLLYSTVVAAPNAAEMVAGACLWSGLLTFGGPRRSQRVETLSIAVIAISAVLLANFRMLGPVWVLLIVLVAVIYIGPATLAQRCREHRAGAVAATSMALLGGLAAAAWTLTAGGLEPPTKATVGDFTPFVFSDALEKVPLWMLQVVGAFPYPNQPGPIAIYPLVLVVVFALLVLAARVMTRRALVAVVGALVAVIAAPVILTLLTMNTQGIIWQGRYGLPFIVGILPMAGLALDRSPVQPQLRRLIPLALLLLGAAQVLSVNHVLRAELGRAISVADASWIQAPAWVICLLMTAGWLVMSAPLVRHSMGEAR